MTTPTKRTKRTAKNSKFLAGVKRTMNAKIYAHCMLIANSDSEVEALAYLHQYFNQTITIADFEYRADHDLMSGRFGRQRADETLEEMDAREEAARRQEVLASATETTQHSAPVAQPEPATLQHAITLLRSHQQQLAEPKDDFTTGYGRGLQVAIRILELAAAEASAS